MLTFQSPLFLWGLLGLAAPVLIHLINRDLFRPLVFPSIRFIRRGKMPVQHKRRLRDLLLLALRLLLFAAVVSALARPTWQSASAAEAAETGDLVILLDASSSMSSGDSWEEALQQVEELLAGHGTRPAGLVISADRPVAVEPLTTEHAGLRRAAAEAAPRPVAGNHRQSLRQALRLFEGRGGGTLAIVSDFQSSDWSPSSLPQLNAEQEIKWVQVGNREAGNAAIVDARALPLPDGRRQVVAEIRNFGDREIARTVEVRAGDQTASRQVELAGGESRSVTLLIEEGAASTAEITFGSDTYTADDTFFLWLGRPPPLRVLAVAPLDEEPEKAEELFFVTRALQTRTESDWLDFSVEPLRPGGLASTEVEGIHAILLLGSAPYLEDGDWGTLRRYREDGGRLFFTPGNAPARQADLLREHGMIDLSHKGAVRPDPRQLPIALGEIPPQSLLAELFREDAGRSLSHVSIYQYTRTDPGKNIAVHLITNEGHPLIMEDQAGSGSVLASAVAFQTGWTDLPVTTAFLPMIRELIAGALPPNHGIIHLETGEGPVEIAARLGRPADDPAIRQLDTDQPGVTVVGNFPVVLNVPRSESLPATSAPLDLEAALAPGSSRSAGTAVGAEPDRQFQLWPWLALAGLLLFILEIPLAARMRQLRREEAPLGASQAGLRP